MIHRAAVVALLGGCHLGVPPRAGVEPVAVGEVRVPAAEPGLADALRSAVSASLARRGLVGEGDALELTVLEASDDFVAVSGDRRVLRATLVVDARLLGARPRSVVLRAERSYDAGGDDGRTVADRRAATFASLADQLARDLAAWLQAAPPPAPPSPREP